MILCSKQVAWAWWRKLEAVRRRGLAPSDCALGQDFEIEDRLARYAGRFAWSRPKWDYRLRKTFGESSASDMRCLRKAVEKELSLFRQIAAPGGAPPLIPLERTQRREGELTS